MRDNWCPIWDPRVNNNPERDIDPVNSNIDVLKSSVHSTLLDNFRKLRNCRQLAYDCRAALSATRSRTIDLHGCFVVLDEERYIRLLQ